MIRQIKSRLRQFFTMTTHSKVLMNRIDTRVAGFMAHLGHRLERWLLGAIFFWFGNLKLFGELSASSLIAKSVYWFRPGVMVPVLGVWEALIGLCLVLPHLQRIAILLLLLRLPGTILAMVYNYPLCFDGSIFTPTIQGQYLLKELTLLGAALVIGGTVRQEE